MRVIAGKEQDEARNGESPEESLGGAPAGSGPGIDGLDPTGTLAKVGFGAGVGGALGAVFGPVGLGIGGLAGALAGGAAALAGAMGGDGNKAGDKGPDN